MSEIINGMLYLKDPGDNCKIAFSRNILKHYHHSHLTVLLCRHIMDVNHTRVTKVVSLF